jgi:hypothetical protein
MDVSIINPSVFWVFFLKDSSGNGGCWHGFSPFRRQIRNCPYERDLATVPDLLANLFLFPETEVLRRNLWFFPGDLIEVVGRRSGCAVRARPYTDPTYRTPLQFAYSANSAVSAKFYE